MFTKIHLKILYIFLLLIFYSIRANAHEFWIEPTQYQLNDDLINAHLRVGQEFQGMVLMYNPKDFKTFKILSGSKNKKEKIKGILGDVPAINITTNLDNLLIIYHETKDKYVDYKKFQKFEDFVNEKGYQHLINTHFDKGFPKSNFIESYRRYAKSLITLNGNEGKDKKTGLLFESGNPKSLCDKLNEIIKLDTLTLDLMGREGRKNVINRFNIEKMCLNTYSEYKKLVNQ